MSNFFSTILADIEAEWVKLFGTTAATISAAVVTDINLIGTGLNSALAEFEAVTGLDAAAVTQIEADISSISAAAASVATTVATNIAKPIATQIATDFASLTATLKGVTLPASLQSVINAVTTILPYVEMGVGILTSASVGAAESTGLTADEARLILKAA